VDCRCEGSGKRGVMAKIENKPTRDGFELGYMLARFVDNAKEPVGERCFTCAFRQGTDANGSPTTTMDALKCVMEGVPFYCHETEPTNACTRLCAGYATLRADSPKKLDMPWPFSDEVEAK
jgi:hypothetical protein